MSNPILERTELSVSHDKPMTVNGVVYKSIFLVILCAVSALGVFGYGVLAGFSASMYMAITIAGLVASIVLSVVLMFKPHFGKAIAIPYGICEGLFVGGIAGYTSFIYPSVPFNALCATFVTAMGMLTLYRTGIIKVTAKMRSVVTSAVIAIMVVYLISWIMSLFFSSTIPGLFDGGLLAIGFSFFVITVASFFLLLNFDDVEQAARAGVSQDMEWVLSIGILSTLVWMYIEFVRLLGFLED